MDYAKQCYNESGPIVEVALGPGGERIDETYI